MKVTYLWLKDFVDIKISPQKLADKLTMAGLNVASLEQVAGDWVYDIEVTSNRPDWLSVRGIAHEVAAVTGARLKKSTVHSPQTTVFIKKGKKYCGPSTMGHGRFSIGVEDAKDCLLYTANIIINVKVGPSPEWLAKRLEAVGVRSVNNIVDITNYCMLEYGQPLHAFDYDKVGEAKIIVRRAVNKEKIVLIDGLEKELSSSVLVIADDSKPIAVAGVMGGVNTETSFSTTNVLLESACFSPFAVRKSSRVLGVASDSSYRFERGVDLETLVLAAKKAVEMICDLCGGTLVFSDVIGSFKPEKTRKISFSLAEANDVLSLDVSIKEAGSILTSLGCKIKVKKAGLMDVLAPSFRKDIKISQDLTEEIARIYGYDRIPLTAFSIKPFFADIPMIQALEQKLKELLVNAGLKEIITYSLMAQEDYDKSSVVLPQSALRLENSLSQEYSILRTSLIPSLLKCAAFNINRNNTNFEFFEVAHIFDSGAESLSLGIVLCGSRRGNWKKESVAYTIFDLKGILEILLDELQVKDYEFISSNASSVIFKVACQGRDICSFGKVSDAVKKAWDIKYKEDIFVAELVVDMLAGLVDTKKVFKAISSRPTITRDISLLVKEVVSYLKIKELIKVRTQGYLKNILFAELYQGKEIPKGSLGLTISIEYGCDDRTLTDAEVNPLHQAMLDCLIKDLAVVVR